VIVGIVQPSARDIKKTDRPRSLAVIRTNLAVERSALASERTLMAWIRTALAMISFGFTIGKLGDALRDARVNLLGRRTDILGVAYYLVILGTLALILGAVQFKVEQAGFAREGLPRRPSLAFWIAVLLALLGMFVFTDLATQF
jgi:putative membrane protein